MGEMTLADRVLAQINDAGLALDHKPPMPDLSQFELNCVDIGVLYGIAWAFARGEDPYEPARSVGPKAQSAARQAWQRWSGDPSIKREQAQGEATAEQITRVAA